LLLVLLHLHGRCARLGFRGGFVASAVIIV